jgi:hypothetical protein
MKRTVVTIACAAMLCSGCGITTQTVVPDKVVREKQTEAVQEEYASGFRAGYEAARQELAKKISEDAQAMKALKIYQRLIYEGAMAPPEVVTIHRPERLSADGQRYTSAQTETVIRRPARFVRIDPLSSLLSERGELYGIFPDEESAAAAIRQVQGKTGVIPTDDGRYAVYELTD